MCFGGSNTTTTQSGPPAQVLQNYQNLTNQANKVGQNPLQQYSGQMIAGFSPAQLEAMQGVQNAQNIANPYINTASQYASSAATPIGVPGQLSNGQLGGLYSQGLGYSNQAAGTNIAGAGQAGINQINSGIGGINNAIGMGSAQNYADNVAQYMSPYTQNVVNATQAEFNNQNAQQNQGIIGNAISSGAWGGDRAGVAQGIAAGQEALAQAPVIANLQQQGYTNAQSQLNQQQALGLQGAQAQGQLGSSIASLGESAASQQAALKQQAAAQQLGLYSGQQQTGIGAQEASGWLGANAANIYGALGQQAQSSALTDASALYNMGSQQQNLEQEQLNIPYEQFQAQQAYPFQVAQWEANIGEGLGGASGGTSTTTAPGPSGLSQFLGAGLGAAGIVGATGGFGSTGWLTGTPLQEADIGGSFSPVSSIGGLNTGSLPSYFKRGGRIARAAGGGMGMTNSPFGAFASPMANGMTFGQPPKGFAAGGIAGLSNSGVENPSINIIPVSTGQSGMANQWLHQPVTTQTQSSDGGLLSDLGPVLGIAKLAAAFADGGAVPQGFASGGQQKAAPAKTNDFNQSASQMVGDFPVTGVVGSQMGSRGISHPVLASPQNSNFPSDHDYGLNLIANYSPPPVSSLPYSTTSFPVLNGSTGQPTTTEVKPTLGSNGQWTSPGAPPPIPTTGMGTQTNGSNIITLPGGETLNLTGLASGLNFPYANGGAAHGFRSHFDDGGLVGQAGATSAGLPVSGGNPLAQGMYQNFAHLPPEKLQELAVRLPPSSPQGQLVRRALQMSHAAPQQQMQQPMMAAGGRAGYDGGGATDDLPAPDDVTVLPPDLRPANSTIFGNIGGSDAAAAKGFDSPVPAPAGLTPKGGSTIPTAPAAQPPADADLAGRTPNALSPAKGVNESQGSSFMQSPWLALAAAGAGMLASRDPHAGVAIGQGLETGLKFGEEQQKTANENQWRNKDVDLRAQQLSQNLEEQKTKNNQFTAEQARLAQDHQDQVAYQKAELAQRAADSAENRAIRQQLMEQGRYGQPVPMQIHDPDDPTGQKMISGFGVLNTKTGKVDFHNEGELMAKPEANAAGTPTVPVRDSSQSQEDYLNSLEPKFRGDVQALIGAQSPYPTGISARNPYSIALTQAAHQADPTFNASTYANRAATAKNFDQGPLGNTTRALSVAVAHTNTLNSLVDALGNNDIKALNAVGNYWANQTGNPAPTNFDAAKQIVGDELVKAVVGAGGGVADRDKLQATLDKANSPEALRGVIQTYQTLMKGQLSGLQQQYEQGTGRHDYLTRLTPEARMALAPPPIPAGTTLIGHTPSGLPVVKDADGKTHVVQ